MKNFAIDDTYRPFHGSTRPCARAITLLCALAMVFSGCTTTRTLDANGGTAGSAQLKAGDTVNVVLRDGQEMNLSFVEWNDEQLIGLDKHKQSQSVYRSDIVRMETTDKNGGMTTTLFVVSLVVVGALLLMNAMEGAAAGALCC
jgi:hypothetical protein